MTNGFNAEFGLQEGKDDHSLPIPPIAFLSYIEIKLLQEFHTSLLPPHFPPHPSLLPTTPSTAYSPLLTAIYTECLVSFCNNGYRPIMAGIDLC